MKDLDELARLARDHYLTLIKDELGQPGIDVVKELHPYLKRIFSAIDYESVRDSLTVFKLLDDVPCPLDSTAARMLDDPAEIASHNKGVLTLQILPDGRLALWQSSTEPEDLPPQSITYVYRRGEGERFWVNAVEAEVVWRYTYPLFGLPLFSDLHGALKQFATIVARSCECAELTKAWREPARVMWRSKPEAYMRRSLYYFLRVALRDGRPDVQQEAPADDKNPVDLTVRWAESNRIGIIEVKWLGKSGDLDPPKITDEWSEKRAKDALQQLIDYLELTRARAPLHDRRGYLVVFDGRRAKVKADSVSCSREDGLAYEGRHITYDPELLHRHDMAEPVRCFCEPNWVHGRPSRTRTRTSAAA